MLRQHSGRFGMRELWRMCVWGMAAAVALILAVFAGSTDAGVDRARHAALQLREVFMPSGIKPARPLDAIEGRKLAETVRVLIADRERLIARIAALEHNVDDVTSSITRVERTAPPPAEPSRPPTMWAVPPTTAPSAPTAPTKQPEDDVTSSVGKPEAPPSESEPQTVPGTTPPGPVAKRQFGIDLGGAPSEDALRTLWTAAVRRHGALMQSLRPMVLTREHPRGGSAEYRLIAGPIANAAKAARFCAAITGTGGVCQPAVYEGQKLAIR
jgi:hypothetical protein